MLHNIGGSSIEEAKENLSYEEVLAWQQYRRKRGSLNTGTRMEWGFALLATILVQANGGKAGIEDFMPHADERVGGVDDVMKLFGGAQ